MIGVTAASIRKICDQYGGLGRPWRVWKSKRVFFSFDLSCIIKVSLKLEQLTTTCEWEDISCWLCVISAMYGGRAAGG